MKLILENVRSFAGKHELPIAPLTLLVGENSSGKSTCLAMLSAIFSAPGFPSRPAFNEPPFDLGGYDTIANYKGGRAGRARHFSFGYAVEIPGRDNPTEVYATYKSSLGQPVLGSLSVKRNGETLVLSFDADRVTGRLTLQNVGQDTVDLSIDQQLPGGRLLTLYTLAQATYGLLATQKVSGPPFARQVIDFLDNIPKFHTIAVAPVRTKPRRTYDPISDEFRPEGDHIPLILARALAATTTSGRQRDQFRQALIQFGESSGLFTEVRVKNLGKSPSDPFRILVAVAGPPFNLSDVGYGVSQSLPVVVESTLGGSARLLLLQQPEVHLHPRAQAALGSFFAQLVNQQKRFVIETHSDHLVDRVRQEVAKGTIDASLVRLIFFERVHGESKVYPLSLDKQGNVLDAPASYREFFLREEEALLKRSQTHP